MGVISYVNWDCEDVESECEDCIDAYIEKSAKQHLKRLKHDLSNVDELLHCDDCEKIIEICCNCKDATCDHRVAGEPGSN